MMGDLPAEVQIDGGVASGHRGLVRREEQRGAQQDPRCRRQRRFEPAGGGGRLRGTLAEGVDQQAEPKRHDCEQEPQQAQPELAKLGEHERHPRHDAHAEHHAEKPSFEWHSRPPHGAARTGTRASSWTR